MCGLIALHSPLLHVDLFLDVLHGISSGVWNYIGKDVESLSNLS